MYLVPYTDADLGRSTVVGITNLDDTSCATSVDWNRGEAAVACTTFLTFGGRSPVGETLDHCTNPNVVGCNAVCPQPAPFGFRVEGAEFVGAEPRCKNEIAVDAHVYDFDGARSPGPQGRQAAGWPQGEVGAASPEAVAIAAPHVTTSHAGHDGTHRQACERNRGNADGDSPEPAHRARKENEMLSSNVLQNRRTRRQRLVACSAAIAAAFTVSLPQLAHARRVVPPAVPAEIQVEEGNTPFLEGHATGTQNYICLPCPNASTPASACPDASGFAWILFTPEATLFNDREKQIITHFFSPNPSENGKIRAAWQDSRDSSIVWGGQATPSTDAAFVAQDAIPWLRLPMGGTQEGPKRGRTLTATSFIHRVNTAGGVAPSTGCAQPTDVGAKAFVPYSADYIFYTDHSH